MRLWIAEKPSLARAILEGLGGDTKKGGGKGYYQIGDEVVTWCIGHLMEIAPPVDQWELKYLPIKAVCPPTMQPLSKTEEQFNIVCSFIEKATTIVNAGDNDPEGQLLIDEILYHCNTNVPVMRVLISDLNLEPVKKAIANLQPNEKFKGLYLSALARAIGDQAFGFNMTQAYTLMGRKIGYGGLLAIGRVQTVLFGWINERTIMNQNHKGSYFYTISAKFLLDGLTTKARYIPTSANILNEKGDHLIDEKEANSIVSEIKDSTATVTALSKSEEKQQPPRPFSLSALQQICAKRWGYSAIETLNNLQSLYETHKLVTYPRSDNRYLSDEHYNQREDLIKIIGQSLPELIKGIENTDLSLKHSAFNTSKIEAHHGIIPALKNAEGIKLNQKEMNIYKIICSSFVALFYPPSVRAKTSIVFTLDSEDQESPAMKFQGSQTVLTKAGWEIFYKEDIEVEKPIEGIDISTLEKGCKLRLTAPEVDKRKTQPPKYHIECTLLAAMNKAGKYIRNPALRKQFEAKDKGDKDNCGSIGTEATKAALMETIKSRPDLIELVEMKGYKTPVFRTTKKGQQFCAMLPQEFLTPDISAIWSQKQTAIMAGELTIESFVDDLNIFIDNHVAKVKHEGVKLTVTKHPCPKCKVGLMLRLNSPKGFFWGCNDLGESGCKCAVPDRGNKPDLTKAVVKPSGFKCPICDSDLFRKPAKSVKGQARKYYYSCSDYPNCKASYQEKNREPVFN